MVLRYSHKTKSPTFVELFADRGHPSPIIFNRAKISTKQLLYNQHTLNNSFSFPIPYFADKFLSMT